MDLKDIMQEYTNKIMYVNLHNNGINSHFIWKCTSDPYTGGRKNVRCYQPLHKWSFCHHHSRSIFSNKWINRCNSSEKWRCYQVVRRSPRIARWPEGTASYQYPGPVRDAPVAILLVLTIMPSTRILPSTSIRFTLLEKSCLVSIIWQPVTQGL